MVIQSLNYFVTLHQKHKMRDEAIKAFIIENSHIFWYTPKNKLDNISDELLVESVLNYGDMETIIKLMKLMGKQQMATVFFGIQGRKKLNIYPEIYNLFSLYFKKNIQANSQSATT